MNTYKYHVFFDKDGNRIEYKEFLGCGDCKVSKCEYRDDCSNDCLLTYEMTIKKGFTEEDINKIREVIKIIGKISIKTGLSTFQDSLSELMVLDYYYTKEK